MVDQYPNVQRQVHEYAPLCTEDHETRRNVFRLQCEA